MIKPSPFVNSLLLVGIWENNANVPVKVGNVYVFEPFFIVEPNVNIPVISVVPLTNNFLLFVLVVVPILTF